MRHRLPPVAAAVLVGLAAAATAWGVVTDRLYDGRVLPGVTVDGADVGGMAATDLPARIEMLAQPALARTLVVRAPGVEAAYPAHALGRVLDLSTTVASVMAQGRTGRFPMRLWDRLQMHRRPAPVPIAYRYETAVARATLRGFVAGIAAEPKDVEVAVVSGRLVATQPSQDGVIVDERASTIRVVAALVRELPRADLVVEWRRPAFTTEMADRMAEPVARFTTVFPYNPDRIHNIRLAASALRGRLLAPEALVSFNGWVGPRTPARGYRKAPVLINNELVPGDGGGVCQVSSTLFNAAVLAEMAVESRTNHSRPVAYVAPGRDATVVHGSIDLRLRNTTGSPLLLWADVGPRSLTVWLFGARTAGREISILVTDRVVLPAPLHTVYRRDPDLPSGRTKVEPARTGLRARTFRVVKQDGLVVRQDVVGVSYYHATPRTISIGTGGERPSRAGRNVSP